MIVRIKVTTTELPQAKYRVIISKELSDRSSHQTFKYEITKSCAFPDEGSVQLYLYGLEDAFAHSEDFVTFEGTRLVNWSPGKTINTWGQHKSPI